MGETLGALRLSEARTFILGGNEVSLTLEGSCGLCSFPYGSGLGSPEGVSGSVSPYTETAPSPGPIGILSWSQGFACA